MGLSTNITTKCVMFCVQQTMTLPTFVLMTQNRAYLTACIIYNRKILCSDTKTASLNVILVECNTIKPAVLQS